MAAAATDPLASRASAMERALHQRADEGAAACELARELHDYRAACEQLLNAHFADQAADVEGRLWAVHVLVNTLFRHELKRLRRTKDRVVETRKAHAHYLHFLKASQRFYRHHVLLLDARCDGIPALRRIARTWKDDAALPTPEPAPIPAACHDQVLLSCHHTLIHLGDLSRYRETELVGKDQPRNWGPAKGYYGLAAELYPDAGHAQNQLAVIAREDGDHFRAVYHLYRSLASKLPYPQAQGNLELEFKRVIAAWDKGQLISTHTPGDGSPAGRALIAWFVRLHSRIYKGDEFAAHDELEGEVLSHLAIELKERPLDAILTKILLINLAAEYVATVQMQGATPPTNIMRTYFFYLRLNVKTFFTLLQVLQPELDRLSEGDDVRQPSERAAHLSDKITAVARRILPGLRLYSTWFQRYWQVLNANIADTLTTVDVQELWKAYAATLTLLASSFPVDQLPQESYMLEEDTETIGFQPLVSPDTMKLWYDGEVIKPKWTDLERNHPNVEMLMRVKDLLVDGLVLTQNAEAPLDLDGARFIYREEGLPSELLASPNNRTPRSPVMPVKAVDLPIFTPEKAIPEDQKSHSVATGSESASTTMAKDNAMHRMVDDLVGIDDGLDPLPEEDENMPLTPPEPSCDNAAIVNDTLCAPAAFSISDLVNTVQNYKPRSPNPTSTLLATPMGRSGSTSSVRPPVILPSLPDGHHNTNSIWNRQSFDTPGSSSPAGLNMNGFGNNAARLSMEGPKSSMSGHVRGNSANSLLGLEATTPTNNGAPRPISGSLGGAAWGNPRGSPSNWGSSHVNGFHGNYPPYGYAHGPSMASPLLFSSYQDNAHSSWGRTPPNGQGG